MSSRPPDFGPAAFAEAWGVSRETRRRLEAYADALARWNKAINLVGPKTVPVMWWRHFHDSAQLYPEIPAGSDRLIDLGSGAGFPGLVLAIMTGLEAHLVESDQRKAAFLREAARRAEAPAVFHVKRVESLDIAPAPVVTARAFAPPDKMLGYLDRLLAPGGIALLPAGQSGAQRLTADSLPRNITLTRLASRTDPDGVILKLAREARER